VRTVAITVISLWACLLAAASDEVRVEPQTILDRTINLRPEVLELALEAYEQAVAGGHVMLKYTDCQTTNHIDK